jgi:hypothetical protein
MGNAPFESAMDSGLIGGRDNDDNVPWIYTRSAYGWREATGFCFLSRELHNENDVVCG